MQLVPLSHAQRLLLRPDTIYSRRIIVFHHPRRLAVLRELQGLVDDLQRADVAEGVAGVDLLDHPFEELVGASGVVVG